MTRFLVTGANGFVGRHLTGELLRRAHSVREVMRHESSASAGRDVFISGDIGPATDWGAALDDVDVVVHLAARAHVLREKAVNPLDLFRAINVLGTARLARSAAAKGVRRLVYLSTVGVNGNHSRPDGFTEQDRPCPHNDYALSKWEAEQALRTTAGETGLEIVVLRPPLVYGPGNPGNFLRLLQLIDSGWPLPLGALNNRRSMLFVGNLVDAIIRCALYPDIAGHTYLIKDGEDVSVPELVRRLAFLMERPPRLVSLPPALLRWTAKMAGRSAEADTLMSFLVVDDSKIRSELEWRPPYGLAHGLKETVAWYRREQSHDA